MVKQIVVKSIGSENGVLPSYIANKLAELLNKTYGDIAVFSAGYDKVCGWKVFTTVRLGGYDVDKENEIAGFCKGVLAVIEG